MSSSRVDVAEPPEMILHFARLKFIPRSGLAWLQSAPQLQKKNQFSHIVRLAHCEAEGGWMDGYMLFAMQYYYYIYDLMTLLFLLFTAWTVKRGQLVLCL